MNPTKRWASGLVGAVISGGASAVTASTAITMMDPKDWSPANGNGLHLLGLIGLTFVISAVVSLFKYLAQHPLPEEGA